MRLFTQLKRALIAVMLVGGISVTANAQYTLQILHGSDFEAGLGAIKSAPHYAAIVDSLEHTYANSLTVSGGDNYIPSPFFNAQTDGSLRTLTQRMVGLNAFGDSANTSANKIRENAGRFDIEILHAIGVRASAVGNHEFDAGTGTFADAIRIEKSGSEIRWHGAQFPYLSANLNFMGDGSLSSLYTDSIFHDTMYVTKPNVALNASGNKTKKIAPATIVTINGERIGLVGATTQIVPTISSVGGVTVKGGVANNMDTLAKYLQPYINKLVAQGINKIVLLSHLQQLQFEKQLATKLRHVDVIVASGSHTLMAKTTDILRSGDASAEVYPFVATDLDGKKTVVVSTDGEYKYVGRLVVTFNANGELAADSVKSVSGAYATDSLGVVRVLGNGNYSKGFMYGKRGYIVKRLCDAIDVIIKSQDGTLFGYSNVFLEGRRDFVRRQETNLGSLSADANLWYARKSDPAVKFSLKNGGGIRFQIGEVKVLGSNNVYQLLPTSANPSANKSTGQISQLDILNSLRFNNGLTIVSIKPRQVKELLEHGVATWDGVKTEGRFPQVGGIKFSFDPSQPVGSKVKNVVTVDSNGVVTDTLVKMGLVYGDTSRIIRTVALNFLVGSPTATKGGDGYPFPKFRNENGTTFNRVDLVVSGQPKTGLATFADNGSEQDAMAEYLAAKHATSGTAYNNTDSEMANDDRIQNLSVRADSIVLAVKSTVKNLTLANIYPNPTDGALFIDIIESGVKSIAVYNLAGVKVRKLENPNFGSYLIDMGDLTKGTYIVRATTNEGVQTFKIMLTK